MSVLSGFAGFAPVAWPSAARLFRVRGVAARISPSLSLRPPSRPPGRKVRNRPLIPTRRLPRRPISMPTGACRTDREGGHGNASGDVEGLHLPNQPPVVSGRADHGTVSVKQEKGPGCGHPSVSLTEVFYISEPGFKGTDNLHVLGFTINSNIDRTLTILVK